MPTIRIIGSYTGTKEQKERLEKLARRIVEKSIGTPQEGLPPKELKEWYFNTM